MVMFKAIVPKKAAVRTPANIQRGVDRTLRDFANAAIREMQEYPPARAWKSRPPRSGPRAGGRRTGAYGRGWPARVRYTRDSVEIVNPVTYSVFVGGPRRGAQGARQARAMRARAWKSVSDVAPRLAKRYRPILLRRIGAP